MATDERGKTLHGYVSNADYSLLEQAVKQFESNINRFVSAAVHLALNDNQVYKVVGEASRIPEEQRLNPHELRALTARLIQENADLRRQLQEIYPNRPIKR